MAGHVDERFDPSAEPVVAPQEGGLVRQVLLDGLEDALVQELCVRRRVEEAVEVRRIV